MTGTTTAWRHLGAEGVRLERWGDREFLTVEPDALRLLAAEAFKDMAFFLRPAHLAQLRAILDDPAASANDHYVARELLRNACVAAGGTFPMCQDTGTALVHGHRGMLTLTDGQDVQHLSAGIAATYARENLRYSQLAPLGMFEEKNTGTNLPAQIDLHARGGRGFEFLFMAKGCGSANKSVLFQEAPARLTPGALIPFLQEKIAALGTSACPPYHLAVVIGGSSAEHTLRIARLAAAKSLDDLPSAGSVVGQAFRDLELEADLLQFSREGLGIGAQFGGKYFCHDVRVIRLARHAGSLPIAMAVSCAADRQVLGKITEEGVFLEELERDPAAYLPEPAFEPPGDVVEIDFDLPMEQLRRRLSTLNVGARVSIDGTLIVARDAAHAKLRAELQAGRPLPHWCREHAIFYAGPAKTPHGKPSGSLGATTGGRMDSFMAELQALGASLVTLAKGNRSAAVTESCQKHGGFYLATIGGPAALLAQNCIQEMEPMAYPELGMEAVVKIRVRGMPAFLVVDDKGSDFYADTWRRMVRR